MARDILLDENDDLIIANGDFLLGDSLTQEVGIILRLNQGDLKSDPLLGPNLIRLEKSTEINEFQERVKVHLERDGKDFNELKQRLTLNSNKQ